MGELEQEDIALAVTHHCEANRKNERRNPKYGERFNLISHLAENKVQDCDISFSPLTYPHFGPMKFCR